MYECVKFNPLTPQKPATLEGKGRSLLGTVVVNHSIEEAEESIVRREKELEDDKKLLDMARRVSAEAAE